MTVEEAKLLLKDKKYTNQDLEVYCQITNLLADMFMDQVKKHPDLRIDSYEKHVQ